MLLPGYILSSQGDRVAMAHSVEGRFPFLDHRVVAVRGVASAAAEDEGPEREVPPEARRWAPGARDGEAAARSNRIARPKRDAS